MISIQAACKSATQSFFQRTSQSPAVVGPSDFRLLQVTGVPEDELQQEGEPQAASGRFAFGAGQGFGQNGATAGADSRCARSYLPESAVRPPLLLHLVPPANCTTGASLCALMNSSISDTSCLKACRPPEPTDAIRLSADRPCTPKHT